MAQLAAKAAVKVSSSRSYKTFDGDGDAILPSDLARKNPSGTVLGPPRAAGIDGGGGDFLSLSSTTATALATQQDSVSGADRSALILESPAAGHTAKSSTDNVRLTAPTKSAGTIEETTALVDPEAAPAHDVTIASTDAMGIAKAASMAMVRTSNAPGLLSEDTVDPPHQNPNPTASTELDTNGRRSGPRPKASTGAARSSTSLLPRSNGDLPSTGCSNTAEPPSISTTAHTGVGRQKGIARAEVEKANGVVLARSKPKSGQMPAEPASSLPALLLDRPRWSTHHALALAARCK